MQSILKWYVVQYSQYPKGLNIASGTQAAATVGYAMIFTCFLYPGKITSSKSKMVSEFRPCLEVDVSSEVIITIFTHDIRLKLFWYNLFKSYQLSETKCQIFSRVMVAVFAPFSYPFFDIVSLVKYTQQKLQLNDFLANERDLGRFYILKSSSLLKNKQERKLLNLPNKRYRSALGETVEETSIKIYQIF